MLPSEAWWQLALVVWSIYGAIAGPIIAIFKNADEKISRKYGHAVEKYAEAYYEIALNVLLKISKLITEKIKAGASPMDVFKSSDFNSLYEKFSEHFHSADEIRERFTKLLDTAETLVVRLWILITFAAFAVFGVLMAGVIKVIPEDQIPLIVLLVVLLITQAFSYWSKLDYYYTEIKWLKECLKEVL